MKFLDMWMTILFSLMMILIESSLLMNCNMPLSNTNSTLTRQRLLFTKNQSSLKLLWQSSKLVACLRIESNFHWKKLKTIMGKY